MDKLRQCDTMLDDILNIEDTKTKSLYIPEWQGEILLRAWTGQEKAEFKRWAETNKDRPEGDMIFGKIAALSIANQDGTRKYKDIDAKALAKKNSNALERIAQAVAQFNVESLDEKKVD